jgi:hypothetical protein
MGCRCNERGKALSSAASAVARGNMQSAGKSLAYVGRTLTQDVRSGAIKTAAANRLAQMRATIKR